MIVLSSFTVMDRERKPTRPRISIESSIVEEVFEPAETKLSAVEKNTILRVIEKHNGNITKAARELGLTRTALYRRLSKYDI